ncbi:hypothetical protein [Amycolatopsis sp. FDAARGOS 1241]|uniref:hypothetical protein n=1 Tax=Amycolatopsis sp. FDAARGOS 1241 TaxID=2778070 RepID=UPI00195133E9|nr:hypothetical protein [Amycolatopsis sp. FDAARGOS 1241]QRP43843.1 hypothetical protein I6J71_31480 [Amycolatopsis sp. FDAARGOS 1241]
MKRLFWLGIGVIAGVALTRKAGETVRQATPAGLASNLGDAVRELAGAVGSFGAEVRAGMSEREQELHDMVEERTGYTAPQGGAGRHAAAARRPVRRARRAEG